MSMDMNELMKQAQQMQAEMGRLQKEAAAETVEASAGGGMVTVKANGVREIVSISIKPEAIDPDDLEMLEDLIVTAVREALEEALGMKFTGDKGEHFFRSTLVQTIFYGVFSAWVLWPVAFTNAANCPRVTWHIPM